MPLLQGKKIWDATRIHDRVRTMIEYPGLIRFKGRWYCSVGESPTHNPHPLGRGRILRSVDGEQWDTVKLLEWDAGSMSASLSITAEGLLMAHAGLYFVSKEPRADLSKWKKGDAPLKQPAPRKPGADPNPMATSGFCYYQLDPIGTPINMPLNDLEQNVAHQIVTWFSADGDHWSSAYASPDLINTQPCRVTWYNGMGYVVSQWGKEPGGATLYRTRDGKSWRVLRERLLPDGHAGEVSLAFGADSTAYGLLRGDSKTQVFIGIGRPPYYQEWEWKNPLVDYGPEHGGPRPAGEVLTYGLGGPQLIRLNDGRFLGVGRAMGPGRDDGHATVFLVDPVKSLMTMIAEFDGTSYPSIVEHDGMIWVSYISSACHKDIWEVHVGNIPVPR